VLPGECDEVSTLLYIRGLGNAGSVVPVILRNKGGPVLVFRVILLPPFEDGQLEIVLDALTVYLLALVVQLTLAEQLLEGEVAAGLDLLLDEGGSLLGAVGTDLAVEGGTDVEVVGLLVEGVFVLWGTHRVDLVAATSHNYIYNIQKGHFTLSDHKERT